MLSLHNLEKSKGATHRKKIRGRGNASGRGNYSTRGIKGQRARAGGRSGIALRSIRSYIMRVPKTRGFKSMYPKFTVLDLSILEKSFKAGSVVNLIALRKDKLVNNSVQAIKILGTGSLTKKLNIEAHAFSASAKQKIEAAGGSIKIISTKKVVDNHSKK